MAEQVSAGKTPTAGATRLFISVLKGVEGVSRVNITDLPPIATMLLIGALIAFFSLVFERYGKPVLHRLTIEAIRKRILKTVAETQTETAAEVRAELPPVPALYAGFDRRAVAVVVDGLLFFFALGLAGAALESINILWAYGVVLPAHYLYQVLTITSKRQATLGMRMAGVYVTDVHGNRLSWHRASMRHAAKLLTFFTGIGPLMALWTKRRQTLADLIVGSVVLVVETAETGNESVPEMYAGYRQRTLSAIVDVCPFFLGLVAIVVALESAGVEETASLLWAYGFALPAYFLYQVLTITSKRQATFGMRLAKVYVTDVQGNRLSWKRASMRLAAKLLTLYSLIGLFMPLWTKRRQFLHDLLAGSVVRCGKPHSGGEPKSPPGETRIELPALSAAVDS